MQPKTRILTAFLCLLPSCGVSIVSIGQQSQLVNSSLPEKAAQSGFSGLNLNTYASTDKKINLESSQVLSPDTTVKDENINNLKIDLNFVDNKILLPEFNSLDSSVPVNSARKIIKEIKIEKGVTDIQGQATQLIEKSRETLKGKSYRLSQAENIVKRETQNTANSQNLEHAHRKVIWDYLSTFSDLQVEKLNLLDALLRVEGINFSEILNDASKSRELAKTLQALKDIGWIREPSQIYKHKPELKSGKKHLGEDLGWGDWKTQNPYRYFFESQNEWLEFINEIIKAENELFNYVKTPIGSAVSLKLSIQRMNIENSEFATKLVDLKEKVNRSHKELEKRIARKLLQDMGFAG